MHHLCEDESLHRDFCLLLHRLNADSSPEWIENGIENMVFDTSNGSMKPSPYSIFLAKNLPDMAHKRMLDLGTGCGVQAFVAGRWKGARDIHIADKHAGSIVDAMTNCLGCGITGVTAYSPGDLFSTIPKTTKFDFIVCNPASLPQRLTKETKLCYYAGPNGREMIEAIIQQVGEWLSEDGALLMTHTSLADLEKTMTDVENYGLKCFVKNQAKFKFRNFYDQDWILGELRGLERGLCERKKDELFETVYLLEIRRIKC